MRRMQSGTTRRGNHVKQLRTAALKSIATVGEVWARLSEQYEKSGESYLLYWRGVLAQCMDQEDRALCGLAAFRSLMPRASVR